MSVLLNNRKLSKYEFYNTALDIQTLTVDIIRNNFHIKTIANKNTIESKMDDEAKAEFEDIINSSYSQDTLDTDASAETSNIDATCINTTDIETTKMKITKHIDTWLLDKMRERMLCHSLGILDSVTAAYSIYAKTVEELFSKLMHICNAIIACEQLIKDAEMVIEIFHAESTPYMKFASALSQEIKLLKAWHKSSYNRGKSLVDELTTTMFLNIMEKCPHIYEEFINTQQVVPIKDFGYKQKQKAKILFTDAVKDVMKNIDIYDENESSDNDDFMPSFTDNTNTCNANTNNTNTNNTNAENTNIENANAVTNNSSNNNTKTNVKVNKELNAIDMFGEVDKAILKKKIRERGLEGKELFKQMADDISINEFTKYAIGNIARYKLQGVNKNVKQLKNEQAKTRVQNNDVQSAKADKAIQENRQSS